MMTVMETGANARVGCLSPTGKGRLRIHTSHMSVQAEFCCGRI